MRDNSRVGERFELSLDGRQIASVVVGALVLLAVVFVLGYNVGRQVGSRERPAEHGDLAALDREPVDTTFWDKLPRSRPAPPPSGPAPGAPAAPSAPSPAPVATPPAALVAAPPPAPLAEPAERPAPPSEPAVADPAPPAPAAALAEARPAAAEVKASAAEPALAPKPPAVDDAPAAGPYSVQVGASQSRAEANRLAARFARHGARVVEGESATIGHVYRVRVGSFGDRAAATRLADRLARETGVKGFVARDP